MRLQQSIGNSVVAGIIAEGGMRPVVQRHKVAGTDVHRHTRAELLDPPGTTLGDFEKSIEVQADWFAEKDPKKALTAAERTDLHALLRRTTEGPHILAGVGDLLLSELRTVAAADWTALAEYGRGRRNNGDTVRLIDAAPRPLADRIAIGKTLLALKPVIPPAVMGSCVSEAQLLDVHTGALVPQLDAYFKQYEPHLQQRYEVTAGARAEEFQLILDLVRAPGIAPFASLKGRVRNLHRFPVDMLKDLVTNWADTSRKRPVHLILFSGHDAAGAFLASRKLFADLVADKRNLHLMLEGSASLADITAAVPTVAATYGKKDAKGTPRIGQVMIAGHGEATKVELAGHGPATVSGGNVSYGAESMDIADPAKKEATQKLLDTLITNMDPKTARVVYAGCLVGSNPVPLDKSATAGAHIAGNPSLAAFTEQRGAAAGLKPGFTQAARASVGLSGSSSLMDKTGNMGVQYDFDPTAFGDALTYVATGHEPEGVFRAAVEVASTGGATGPVTAETQLRTRLKAGVSPKHGWFDEVTIAGVQVALDGVAPGAGVPVEKLNQLAHMVGPPFLVGNADDGHGRNAAHVADAVNKQPLGLRLYDFLGVMPTFVAPGSGPARNGRIAIDQAWLAAGGPRADPMIAWLDATPTATRGYIASRLQTPWIKLKSALLFPAKAAVTIGRIRLALAWMETDAANADVRAFMLDQVEKPATGPQFSKAVKDQLDGADENDLLTTLGAISTVVVVGKGGKKVELPKANAQVRKGKRNEVRIEPQPFEAVVLASRVNIRPQPNMSVPAFAVAKKGETLPAVGFAHDWVGIDRSGRLGFVHRTLVTGP